MQNGLKYISKIENKEKCIIFFKGIRKMFEENAWKREKNTGR